MNKEVKFLDNELKREFELLKPKIDSFQNKNKIVLNFQWKEFYKREIDYLENNFDKVIENRKKYSSKKDNYSYKDLLNGVGIMGAVKKYSFFNAEWAMWFYKKYNIQTIYDPCMGWGHRMIAALKLGIPYMGNDINKNVVENNKDISIYLKNTFGIKTSVILLNKDSSKLNKKCADCIFTCPPYLNKEIYTNIGAENLNEEKFEKWFLKTISSGYFKYYAVITDQRTKPILERCFKNLNLEFVENVKVGKNIKNHFSKNKKEFEELLVYQRKYVGYIYKTEVLKGSFSGKIYIGMKRRDIFDKNYHGSGKIIKNIVSKYGEDSVKTTLIKFCESFKELKDSEFEYVKKYGNLNIVPGGLYNPWNMGIPMKEESKKKMSETWKKTMSDPKTKARFCEALKLSAKRNPNSVFGGNRWEKGHKTWNKGLKMSEEFKKRVSEGTRIAMKDKKQIVSEKTKEAMKRPDIRLKYLKGYIKRVKNPEAKNRMLKEISDLEYATRNT